MNSNLLQTYWNFFAVHKFPKEAKPVFFEDGCFAIQSTDHVELYYKNAQMIRRYEDAFVLETGVIGVKRENGYVFFLADGKDTPIGEIQKDSSCHATILNNAVVIGKKFYLFNSKDEAKMRAFSVELPENAEQFNWSVSKKGLVAITYVLGGTYYSQMYSSSGMKLITPPFEKAEFYDDYYIFRTIGRSELYDYNNFWEPVYVSEQTQGIMPIGPWAAMYENKLMVTSQKILGLNPTNALDIVATGNVVISNKLITPFPTKGTFKGTPGYWLGETIGFQETKKLGKLFITWHNEKFHVIALQEFEQQRRIYVHENEKTRLYIRHINEMLPRCD